MPETDDEPQSPLAEAVAAVGGLLVHNPALVGGTTAFIVALGFISANAIWYQPHFHSGAFFSTRSNDYIGPPDPTVHETTIRIESQGENGSPRARPDAVVERVQAILKSMNFYEGEVDGLMGPNTRKAIEAYRQTMGMELSGNIDDDLLDMLGAADKTAAIELKTPVSPGPQPKPDLIAAAIEQASDQRPDPMIMKIQAGLKAFGNDKMEIDGVIGSKTKAAIREFQSLFGLPVTGEPTEEVYAKMREIGLAN